MGIAFDVVANDFPAMANALPGDADDLVQTATFNIFATAQELVPVRDGFLKGSGKPDFEDGVGYVYYTMEYAAYVEFGTTRMRAQPYLTPAVELERPKFMLGMQRLFD